MATNIKQFKLESKHGAFYTGDNFEWHEDTMYSHTPLAISLLSTQDMTLSQTICEDNTEEADHIQTFTTDGEKLVSSHKSGLLKLWNPKGELVKMWKYIHKGPIARLTLRNQLLASGGSDGVIRVWDLEHQTCTLSLEGCQGVVNIVEFHPEGAVLLGSGDDGRIQSWDSSKGASLIGYNAHNSKVTSLVFSNDGKYFVTSGRDKVMILWQLGEIKALRTIPVNEAVEAIVNIPGKFILPGFKFDPECVYVASGGENGLLRVWDVTNAKEIYKQQNPLVSKGKEGGLAITKLLFNKKKKTLAMIVRKRRSLIRKTSTV